MTPKLTAAVPTSRREAAIRDLRYAIADMTRRYGWSCTDLVLAQRAKDADLIARHSRALGRRLDAVDRLALALAKLAEDGAR